MIKNYIDLDYIENKKCNTVIYTCCHEGCPIYDYDCGQTFMRKKIYQKDAEIYEYKGQNYSEFVHMLYVRRNCELPSYVGFEHYRRRFIIDDIEKIEEKLKKHDIILKKKYDTKSSIYKNYEVCHNIKDLEIITDIIHSKFKDISDKWDKFLKEKEFYANDLFIMKREDFYKYVDFVFSVIDEFDKITGCKTPEEYSNHVRENYSNYINNYNIRYQSRFPGFIMERLSGFYFEYFFRNPYISEVVSHT
jgi:hypothetical protein